MPQCFVLGVRFSLRCLWAGRGGGQALVRWQVKFIFDSLTSLSRAPSPPQRPVSCSLPGSGPLAPTVTQLCVCLSPKMNSMDGHDRADNLLPPQSVLQTGVGAQRVENLHEVTEAYAGSASCPHACGTAPTSTSRLAVHFEGHSNEMMGSS